jgi:chorismate dehydratase
LLMIGDRAMHPPRGPFVAEWDLGDEWCRWSELPFVFAMWVCGAGVRGVGVSPAGADSGLSGRGAEEQLDELASLLNQARDSGVMHLEEIAAREHAAAGLSYADCLLYLRDHLHYYLEPRELAGLRLFQEHAQRMGLAPQSRKLPNPVGYASA